MAQTIPNFRTQAFRDIIFTIATQKGYVEDRFNKIKYNFDLNGNIKPLSINKVKDDYIAYFKVETTNYDISCEENNIQVEIMRTDYVGITYNDYVLFTRNNALSEILDGDKVNVKSCRKAPKIKKAPLFEPKVGDKLHLGNDFDGTKPCKVVKRTPKQVTVEQMFLNDGEVYNRSIVLKLDEDGNWAWTSKIHSNDYLYQNPIQESKESIWRKENDFYYYD